MTLSAAISTSIISVQADLAVRDLPTGQPYRRPSCGVPDWHLPGWPMIYAVDELHSWF
jgi:hypothetical protein